MVKIMKKIMIASDIHGSAYYCEKMLECYRNEKADMLVLLGDILYHGPRNDLPKDYAPKKVIAMLNPLKNEIICVRGNCDTEVDQMVLDVNFNTKEQTILEKSFSAYVYTNEELGSVSAEVVKADDSAVTAGTARTVSDTNGATGKAVLELTNLKENTDYAWYAVVTNTASDIEKSGVYEFTTAKKNESANTGGSDSNNRENTNSDKLIGSVETGDRAKIWLFVLLGLSAAGIGAVTVIKKKEA